MAVKTNLATLLFGRTAVMVVAIGAAGLAGASLDAKKKGEWLVFMIHGMARGYDAWENPQELEKHLAWVKEQKDVCVLSFADAAKESRSHTFEIGESEFLLDGKPFLVRCGEIHYARIPCEYWQHRLKMLRAMGCNAVGCYMFWNFHEREKGVFKWKGRADAAAFCRMAQEEGLWVILRPGPYSCAEWEGGGAPWWLMGEGGTGNGKNQGLETPCPLN